MKTLKEKAFVSFVRGIYKEIDPKSSYLKSGGNYRIRDVFIDNLEKHNFKYINGGGYK